MDVALAVCQGDMALGGRYQCQKQAEQGRLAASVVTDQGGDFAGAKFNIYICQDRLFRRVGKGDLLKLQLRAVYWAERSFLCLFRKGLDFFQALG